MNIDVKKISGGISGDVYRILDAKGKTEQAFIEALFIINSFIEYPDCYEETVKRGQKLIKEYEHENETT